MEVILKRPEVQRFVEDQITQGRFASPSEIIEAALLRWMLNDMEEEFDAATLAAIERADEQLARGEGHDLHKVAAEFRAKYKTILGSSNG
jgi:Arc/MetJ-type ribon-helix-helix transcriptional regulator